MIAEAVQRGVCVSIGHSDADLNAARAAVAAGARHATHTFNAMRPLEHREPGIIGEVLTDARLSADIIADGIHLDPAIVELFLKAKGPEAAVLITDAISATGMPDGRYRLGTFQVEVKDGRCLAGGKLAGSVLTMDRAVRNVMQFAHWDLQQAVRLATLNPARVAGLSNRGKLRPGRNADFLVLSPERRSQKHNRPRRAIGSRRAAELRRPDGRKGGFPHHMLKEIFEQPQGLRDTIAPRVSLEAGLVRLDDVRITVDELCSLQRINIVASGTSRHAGMVGQHMIQDLATCRSRWITPASLNTAIP